MSKGKAPQPSQEPLKKNLCEPEHHGALALLDNNGRNELAYEFVENLGIPPRIAKCWFKGIHLQVEAQLLQIAKNPTESVIIAGDVGRGKSALLSAMLKTMVCEIIRNNPHSNGEVLEREVLNCVTFISYSEFTKQIRDFDSDDDPSAWFEYIKTQPKLLVIDDLLDGSVKDWDLIKLSELIDYRYSNHLPIWFTTNFSAKELSQWKGFERSYSRLAARSYCRYFKVTGKDLRKADQDEKDRG